MAGQTPPGLPDEQTAPTGETGTTVTSTRTQARTHGTTAERRHDAPPDKTHGKPKPAVAISAIKESVSERPRSEAEGGAKHLAERNGRRAMPW